MYCGFFNLGEEPFNMKPDPRFLFLSQEHRERLAGLAYGVLNRKNCLVMTGDIGTGKTTLITAVMRYLPRDRTRFSTISVPTLSSRELLEMVMRNFGMEEIPASKAERIHRLAEFLREGEASGIAAALIIDEAHKLTPDVLEEVRMLGNLHALGLILVGQNELNDLLNRPELRALRQRICVRLTIGPLGKDEVEPYIRWRWKAAGGGPSAPFSAEAIGAVTQWSGGVPRLINSICDNPLTVAFEAGEHSVTAEHVQAAVARLKLVVPPVGVQGAGLRLSAAAGAGQPVATAEAAPAESKPRWTLESVRTRIASQLPHRQTQGGNGRHGDTHARNPVKPPRQPQS